MFLAAPANWGTQLFEFSVQMVREGTTEMDHEEHWHEGQMASGCAFGAGEMVSRGKGRRAIDRELSIAGKFQILLRLLAKRMKMNDTGSSEIGRGSYDDQLARVRVSTFEWVLDGSRWSNGQTVRVGSRWITMVEWRVIRY